LFIVYFTALSISALSSAPLACLPGGPIYYHPWRLFQRWYFITLYASDIFLRGGAK
jgi:hypothetical protein